jgi:hypothetical protein
MSVAALGCSRVDKIERSAPPVTVETSIPGHDRNAHITWPVIVAEASKQKARIRAQREPCVSPAGHRQRQKYPMGSLMILHKIIRLPMEY